MPRSIEEILEQADELAARFEQHEPDSDRVTDAAALRSVRLAFQARADAERRLADAVSVARAEGHSWASIGALVGTSGEAARHLDELDAASVTDQIDHALATFDGADDSTRAAVAVGRRELAGEDDIW